MKILIIPKVIEKYKGQFEYSIELNLIKFLNLCFSGSEIEILHNKNKNFLPNIVIISGGNTVKKFSNRKKDLIRSEIDNLCFKKFYKKAVIIGICHGAQFLSTKYNSKIIKCKNHTSPHGLKLKRHFFKNKIFKSIKSHHEFKITKINKFEITSTANDLSVESFINVENKLIGFMWHPERQKDVNIQKKIFLKHFNLINSNLPKNKKF